MPSLEDLSISHCPVLHTVENVDSLQAVHIFDHQLQEVPRWIKALAAKLRSLDVTSTIKLLKRCLVDGPDWPLIKDIVQVHGSTTGSGDYIYYSKNPYIFDSNVNAQGNLETAASDSADEASADNRNANQDVWVAASGTGYMHISGFFDSKAVKKGAPMAEGSVTRRNTEKRNSRRSLLTQLKPTHEWRNRVLLLMMIAVAITIQACCQKLPLKKLVLMQLGEEGQR